MSIHVVGPNDGEQSGGGPIRVRIIEDGSHTGHRLGLIEASVPPGPAMPPQHVHRAVNRVVYDIASKPPGTIEWE